MLIYPLPALENAARLFCNYSFFKGRVHHLVCREKQWKPTREETDWFQKSWCQGHEYFGTQISLPRSHCRREEQIPLPTFSTTFLLFFLLCYTHLFSCNPCFPNTHQHNSHAIPLYSFSICNSQSVLQKAINKLLPPPKVTQKVSAEPRNWPQPLRTHTKDGTCCTTQSHLLGNTTAWGRAELLQGAWHYSESCKNNENYFLSIWGTCKLPFTVISKCQTLSGILTGFEGFQDEVVLIQACLTTVPQELYCRYWNVGLCEYNLVPCNL